jgi:hypothetical protein
MFGGKFKSGSQKSLNLSNVIQVLCPEHHPDAKVGEREVCGYPVSKELMARPTQFCLRAKKHCQMHFCWEKLRRAEIDMERVRQVRKIIFQARFISDLIDFCHYNRLI